MKNLILYIIILFSISANAGLLRTGFYSTNKSKPTELEQNIQLNSC